jgi:hypothetical protein
MAGMRPAMPEYGPVGTAILIPSLVIVDIPEMYNQASGQVYGDYHHVDNQYRNA